MLNSHYHCWDQDQPPACGVKLEDHKQCCLCDTTAPEKERAEMMKEARLKEAEIKKSRPTYVSPSPEKCCVPTKVYESGQLLSPKCKNCKAFFADPDNPPHCSAPSPQDRGECAGCGDCLASDATTGEECVKMRNCPCHWSLGMELHKATHKAPEFDGTIKITNIDAVAEAVKRSSPQGESEIEKMYEKIKPLVVEMKSRYPENMNIEGFEPALTSDIAEIVLKLLSAQQAENGRVLKNLLKRYVDLANSGDAGFWDCETESEVIEARRLLSKDSLPENK